MNHIVFSKIKGDPIFVFMAYGDGNHDGGGGGVLYCSGEECNAPLSNLTYNTVFNFIGNGDGYNIYVTFIFEEYQ